MVCKFARAAAALGFLSVFFLTTCDMGLGPTVDLEPPILEVQRIILPDGSVHPVLSEDGGKLFIGPGILFNDKESYLEGRAKDNKEVVGILVEELDRDGNIVNSWEQVEIGKRDSMGWQEWRMPLHGIRKGERVINITAQDKPKNVGPETVKQLTLLVDTDDPIVESVTIERKPGIQVGLLPRLRLEGFDPTVFSTIDYFQNEAFSIRASIYHEYSITDVWLNFIDSDDPEGGEIFPQPGLERDMSRGTVYTPFWDVDGRDLIRARPELAAGRHYLNVVITARAAAGHSGSGSGLWELDETGNRVNSDILYSLCWYPDADKPYIEMGVPPDDPGSGEPMYTIDKGGLLPVSLFDDDNLDAVYAAVVASDKWDGYMPGSSDDEKLESLYDAAAREAFGREAKDTAKLYENRRVDVNGDPLPPQRNTILPMPVGSDRGPHRLVVVAVDTKSDINPPRPARWGHAIFSLQIIEEGIPMITVTRPTENQRAPLEGGKDINLEGFITNLDVVDFFKVAWVPAALGGDQMALGREALLASAAEAGGGPETMPNGVKVWNIPLALHGDDPLTIGGRLYRRQEFKQAFDIFEDFTYDGAIENAPKFFMLYTQGSSDIFQPFRLLAYTTPPTINVREPDDWEDFMPGGRIPFEIEIYSESGVPVRDEDVTVTSARLEVLYRAGSDFIDTDVVNADGSINLTKIYTGLNCGVDHTDSDGQKHTEPREAACAYHYAFVLEKGLPEGEYSFLIETKDILGNPDQKEVNIIVGGEPELTEVYTDHSQYTEFSSRDNVTIKLLFNHPVGSVSYTENNKPRLALEVSNKGETVTRYAYYEGGDGSNVLDFVYDVEEDDYADSLAVRELDVTGARISAYDYDGEVGGNRLDDVVVPLDKIEDGEYKYQKRLAERQLHIDGIRPLVTGVSYDFNTEKKWEGLAGTGLGGTYDWYTAGDELTIYLAMSKPVRVLGNPKLMLGSTGVLHSDAVFDHLTDEDKTIVFIYTVHENDEAGRVSVDLAGCFSEGDLEYITDKVGTDSNILKPSAGAFQARAAGGKYFQVDAVRPGMPGVVKAGMSTTQFKGFTVEFAGGNILMPIDEDNPPAGNPGTIRTYAIESGARVEYTFDGINWFPIEQDMFWFENKGTVPSTVGLSATGTYAFPASGNADWVNATNTGTSGADWSFLAFENNRYRVSVRQIDRAGNISDELEPAHGFTLGLDISLIGLAIDTPNGFYNGDTTHTFRLTFSGAVSYTGSGASITLGGGTGAANGTGDQTVPFTASFSSAVTMEATWRPTTTGSGTIYYPLIVKAINLGNVRKVADGIVPDNNVPYRTADGATNAYIPASPVRDYLQRGSSAGSTITGVIVMTPIPEINQLAGAGLTANALNSTVIAAPAGSGDNVRSSITMRFDKDVRKGNGFITVRPAANWLIPPVLLSEDYSRIRNAISANAGLTQAERTQYLNRLSSNYAETTHGLVSILKETQQRYVPDTSTKYVLNYEQGLNNANLRPVFEAAKYMWQEIEASDARVTMSGDGTWGNTVTVSLDRLADGRQWIVQVAENAFMDRAGNNNAAWNSGAIGTTSINGYFWSPKVATPVIRVNRTSNNHPTNDPRAAAQPTPTLYDAPPYYRETNRNSVRYRVDCETPNAVISSGVWNKGTSRIEPGFIDRASYRPRSEPSDNGLQNSHIQDATVAELTTGQLQSLAQNATSGVIPANQADWTSYESLFTARKDYIAATATRTNPNLSISDRGYEGAFKTILVSRNMPRYNAANNFNTNAANPNGMGGNATWRLLKFEATNTRNGAVTISGFPSNYNDASGKSSFFAYMIETTATGGTPGTVARRDWVWITWEIVSDFWHVGLGVRVGPGNYNSDLTLHMNPNYDNPYVFWPEGWQIHSYRKYGNWGLQVGSENEAGTIWTTLPQL